MLVPIFYFAATSAMKGALVLVTRWRVEGNSRVPAHGPLIVVSNHLSSIDPPLLAASLRRRVVFMAKEELFHSRMWGWSYRSYGAFPVRRGEADRKALHQASGVLKQGLALGMFPEGTRSAGARMKEASVGTSLIAFRSGAAILPIAITGTEKVKDLGVVFAQPEITVRIGEPFHLPPGKERPDKAALAAATDMIMRRIAEMLPASYRGVYGEGLAGAVS